MRHKIVPNIFALTKEEFTEKLEMLKFSKELHLDYMDGQFTKNQSLPIEEMRPVTKYHGKNYNIHLMAYNPSRYFSKIKRLAIQRVYLHFEVYQSEQQIIRDILKLKVQDIKIGLVLNPSTPPEAIVNFFKEIDSVMLMSVWPGEEGQEFIEETLSKIRRLRQLGFKGEIAVDGGIKPENAKEIVTHGANTLYVGSYISSHNNAKDQYETLKTILKS